MPIKKEVTIGDCRKERDMKPEFLNIFLPQVTEWNKYKDNLDLRFEWKMEDRSTFNYRKSYHKEESIYALWNLTTREMQDRYRKLYTGLPPVAFPHWNTLQFKVFPDGENVYICTDFMGVTDTDRHEEKKDPAKTFFTATLEISVQHIGGRIMGDDINDILNDMYQEELKKIATPKAKPEQEGFKLQLNQGVS